MSDEYKSISLIFLISVILPYIVIIYFDFNGLYGQDSYSYLKHSIILRKHLPDYSVIPSFFWPVVYPLISALFQFIFPGAEIISQMISVIAFSMSAILLFKLLKKDKEGNQPALIYILVFFVLSPYIFRFSLLIMSEMLCLFFIVLTFYAESRKETCRFDYLLTGTIASVLAISTKYASFIIVIFPLFRLYFHYFNHSRKIKLVFAMLVGLIFFAPQLILNGARPDGLYHNDLMMNWSISNFLDFKQDFSHLNISEFVFPNLIQYFIFLIHPSYYFAGIVLIILLIYFTLKRKISFPDNTLILTFMVYYLFICGIPVQNKRFLIIIFPIFLLLLYPAFKYSFGILRQMNKSIFIVVAIIQMVFVYLTIQKPIAWSDSEKQIVKAIDNFNTGNYAVYNSGLDGPIWYYYPETEFHSLFRNKIKTNESRIIVVADSLHMMNSPKTGYLRENFLYIHRNFKVIRQEKITENLMIYEFQR